MLLPITNIWQTRVQNIDALLTAASSDRIEVYYLATVCQVGIHPPLISISPNPGYPICAAIDASGYFGVNFLADNQGLLVERCIALPRIFPDKLAALGLRYACTQHGTPILLDCIQSLEVRVERAWNCGDHRTYVGTMTTRKVHEAFRHTRPHRFGGGTSRARQLIKQVLCLTRIYDLLMVARGWLRPPVDIREGTQRYIPSLSQQGSAHMDQESLTSNAATPVSNRLHQVPGICLIGCGWWGAVHALALKHQGTRIRRYFVSRQIEHARDFARRFDGEAAFDKVDSALAEAGVNAVVIALPHHLHAPIAELALAAGKHVLVEKPMAITVEEGERLVRVAEASGLCLAVAEEYRLSPLVQSAQALLQQGLLGRINVVQLGSTGIFRPTQPWKNSRAAMGGGVLMDVGVHYISILRFWFGEPELVWSARPPQINDRLEGEDTILATFRFANGPVANLVISWSSYKSPEAPNVEIIGELGSLQIRFNNRYLLHSAPLSDGHWAHQLRTVLPWRVVKRVDQFLPKAYRQYIRVDSDDLIGSRALIDNFVQAIAGGKPPCVSGAEGLKDLKIVHAAYQALESGQPVSLSKPLRPGELC